MCLVGERLNFGDDLVNTTFEKCIELSGCKWVLQMLFAIQKYANGFMPVLMKRARYYKLLH